MRIKGNELRNLCPSYVCGKHSSVTQWHHVLPFEELSFYISAWELEKFIEPPTVPLCPTCHAYVHKAIDNPNRVYDESFELSNEEAERMKKIICMKFNFLKAFCEWAKAWRVNL